jgi:hypothetical protein
MSKNWIFAVRHRNAGGIMTFELSATAKDALCL